MREQCKGYLSLILSASKATTKNLMWNLKQNKQTNKQIKLNKTKVDS